MSLKRIVILICCCLLFTPILTSCGYYSLKGSLPAHIQSISISPVINETGEFGVSESLEDQITDIMISENVLDLASADRADSQLDITITSVMDKPYTYSISDNSAYEQVDEWRITVKAQVTWYDLTRDEAFFEKQFSAYGAYGTGVDISTDKIDNDNDGLVDGEDDDEFGSPRESALVFAIRNISEDIINEVTSTW